MHGHVDFGSRVTVARFAVTPPFRLDLTVALLREIGPHPDSNEWAGGRYVRAFPAVKAPVLAVVTQPDTACIEVETYGASAVDSQLVGATVCRMLATSADLRDFAAAAASIPWLDAWVTRMHGVKPACFPTLWEAGVNAIVFQSVSMHAASAVLRRFVATFATRMRYRDGAIDVFPTVEAIAGATDTALRATGLSGAKVRALRALAAAIGSGEWDDSRFAHLPTPEVCTRLCRVAGIGPWSAAVIALRGLGRLDVFPLRDSGVARTVAELAGSRAAATAEALAVLGATRGMLYHLLLLARLDARGRLLGTA